MARKRVFHIVTHFDVGGAERVALSIAKSPTEGVEYHVVEVVRANTAYTQTMLEEMRRASVRFHRAHVPNVRFHYLFERVAAAVFPLWFVFVFARWRPDVIHSHTEVPDMAVWWFFRLFPWLRRRCRVVRTIHNTRLWSGLERTGRTVERSFVAWKSNVAISQAVADAYARLYGSPGPIIHNGLPEVEQRGCTWLRQGRINVLFAGRLEPQKGVTTLLRIIEALRTDERLFFHVVGNGALLGKVQARLASCPNSEWRPPVYGLASMLGAFDYLFMPSEHEGLALLSIEASLAATPTIINRAPGLEETMPPGWPLSVCGNELDDYLRIFASLPDEEGRRSLAAEAQQYARQHFSVESMRRSYEEVYLQ